MQMQKLMQIDFIPLATLLHLATTYNKEVNSHLIHMMYLKYFIIHVIKLNSKFSVEITQLIEDKVLSSNFKSREAQPPSQELCIYCTFNKHTITVFITSHLCTETLHTALHQEFKTVNDTWPLLYFSWVYKTSLHIGCLKKNKI